ncbi:hypothetical protein I4U23_023092 [Adineta vaga]|nr:hypothetical protein I4U23_023092 [Adineta vaga]
MILIFVGYILVSLTTSPISTADLFSVNKVIGDLSFIEKHGSFPLETTSDILRIQTHLEYVESFIRRQTEMNNNNSMKLKILDHLNTYWKQGEFPEHNTSFNIDENRSPRFVDHRNVHCAVGYLILKSPGFEQLPNEINLHNEYSYVNQIKNDNLSKWMGLYDFTLEELSLIQPTYDHMRFKHKRNRTRSHIFPNYKAHNLHRP